ncbi:hypothetical protein [Rheinheimera maricola]|uniref:Uncharacterized protein n=1 Tax=Rheinheimera maricola TaxID=2793282 RepID=A0ABS7XCW4_9GAMM|nr:hypothetical protein [Rheinheimera maricola]MBZ9612568.1 hypothetical protein [Rheinheimera maricola]
MTAKSKGRPLPPLLPLEYCKLDRAARMLSCEVEDILHWGAIGAIRLYLMVDENRYAEIGDHANFIADVEKVLVSGGGRPFQKSYRITPFLDAIVTKNNPTEPEVLLAGLCQIHRQFIEFAYNQPLDIPLNEWVCIIHGDWATQYYALWHNEALTPADLYLTKDELSVLYNAINTGQTLKSKYNDTDIANSIAQNNELISTIKPERNSPGRAKAVTALTELVLKLAGESDDLINNPHKLHRRINELMLEHKANECGGYDLGITDIAYRDLIGAGRAALKKGGK